MSNWRLAESLKTLRTQVNAVWPNRDKSSDGSVGDLSHSQRTSDHNPNSQGVVTAIDIDRELSGQPDGSTNGDTVAILVAKLQASRDPRIKYLIWNRQITVKGDITKWKPYTGVNAHKHHCHISVSTDPKLYDDARAWNLSGTATQPPTTVPQPQTDTFPSLVQYGATGRFVRQIQLALVVSGELSDTDVDESFGRTTEKALKSFQHKNHLDADGKVGPKTRAALKL